MSIQRILPLVAMRGLVVFPEMPISFDVVRDKSLRALEEAMDEEQIVFLTAQREIDIENPKSDDLYRVGVTARIKQVIRMPGGAARVVADGLHRGRIMETLSVRPYFKVLIEEIEEAPSEQILVNEAFINTLQREFESYFSHTKRIAPEMIKDVLTTEQAGRLADIIAANMECDYRLKQELLETFDVYERAEKLLIVLKKEVQVMKIEKQIADEVRRKIDENQREYFLREELNVIERELREKDGQGDEFEEYRKKIAGLDIKPEHRSKLEKEVARLERMQASSADGAVIRNYLDTVLELPWNVKTEENLDLNRAEEILERDHYGLEKVKTRVLEHLAVHTLTNGREGSILCLVGPPGTGKTSIVHSIAEALNRNYVRVSLGGIHDEADIRGHRKTYIAAMPGRIMDAMAQAKSSNPVMLLDELDKMGADFKGDPSAALLEVLDMAQNNAFRDHYVELPFDLSEVMFIATANTVSTIPAPLLDRIEVIEVNGYTEEEKYEIAMRYLIPKQIEKNGLNGKKVTVVPDAVYDLIRYYTRESGVRTLEREIASLFRKIAKAFLTENKKSVKITSRTLVKYMGRHKYNVDMMEEKDSIGVVRGLAWTSVGGDTLSVEANIMPGTGKTELTGNLGDVMKESALTAVSYIRSAAKELKIKDDFYKNSDIHIHVPEGAVPKDGPSAGITLVTAVASALTKRPVRRDVAMTGEVTLRGRVLPIGGLKEKSLAAYRAGIKTVIIPEGNKNDIEEIPDRIRGDIKFIPVSHAEQVLKLALTNN